MRVLVILIIALWPVTASAQLSGYLFLNRCRGGCTITGGADDARAMASSLPCNAGASCGGGNCFCSGSSAGTYMIDEFENAAGQTGDAANAEWAEVLKCVQEVYSPYNVNVVDALPPGVISHTQNIVAGVPENIGWSSSQVGGLATGAKCAPADNIISFSFSNLWGGSGQQRVWAICRVVAQETAHSFGLDHSFEYPDGRSACNDPMSYRLDCGGQRFFRNESARCGENGPRICECGGFQNSHAKLLNVFGAGTPLTAPPTLTVSAPTPNQTIANGFVTIATSYAQRGVARLELWLNNYKWHTVKGVGFGGNGQPESTYALPMPATVPDGVIDVVVKAYDDINAETVSPVITVTKGAPCTSAATCAEGQNCEAGKCFWDPPTGEVGDECTYPQFCKSGECIKTSDGGEYCSQVCIVGQPESCPAKFDCEGMAGQTGFCVNAAPAGDTCFDCGAGDRRSSTLLVLVVALVLRRKRRA